MGCKQVSVAFWEGRGLGWRPVLQNFQVAGGVKATGLDASVWGVRMVDMRWDSCLSLEHSAERGRQREVEGNLAVGQVKSFEKEEAIISAAGGSSAG